MKRIPDSYKVGGQTIQVLQVERCEDNALGQCYVSAGWVKIADKINTYDTQSETSKVNTFYHELVHSILKTMCEDKLNENEKFVCCFASFLCEAMSEARFPGGDSELELLMTKERRV